MMVLVKVCLLVGVDSTVRFPPRGVGWCVLRLQEGGLQ